MWRIFWIVAKNLPGTLRGLLASTPLAAHSNGAKPWRRAFGAFWVATSPIRRYLQIPELERARPIGAGAVAIRLCPLRLPADNLAILAILVPVPGQFVPIGIELKNYDATQGQRGTANSLIEERYEIDREMRPSKRYAPTPGCVQLPECAPQILFQIRPCLQSGTPF